MPIGLRWGTVTAVHERLDGLARVEVDGAPCVAFTRLTGAVEDHNLSEILEIDLEQQHEANMHVPHAITVVGDAMPGFGIVAEVIVLVGRKVGLVRVFNWRHGKSHQL